jgi:uncharacterized protein
MSSPAPLRSFLGGVGVALPAYSLLVLNGSVFGISSFVHGAIRGGKEAAIAASGLILGGMVAGAIEGAGPGPGVLGNQLGLVILSGLLVGIGTRVGPSFASYFISVLMTSTSPQDVQWLHIRVRLSFPLFQYF